MNTASRVSFLKLQTVPIDANDGTETLASATDVFVSCLDGGLPRWEPDQPVKATTQMYVDVCALLEDSDDPTSADIFESFNRDLDSLCLTESQVVAFCRNHRALLRQQGYATFFLVKAVVQGGGEEFFVVQVNIFDSLPWYRVIELSRRGVWSGESRLRAVVPK